MSNLPSIKTLEAAFPTKGKEIRELLEGKRKTKDYASVQEWLKSCYNMPRYEERLMGALNEILEGHGTEAIYGKESETWPIAEYVNMGDTYTATMLYDYDKEKVVVTSWGDWVERSERRVKE